MKFIEKVIGLFTCSKGDGTIKLNNRLIQEDLFTFLNSDIKTITTINDSSGFQICRWIDENSTMYYPYSDREQMEEDYLEIIRLIKKLK